MDEIIDRIPQLVNRVYILGGPRDLALKEAMALILGITDRHYLSTEFYCMKSTEEEIRTEFEETAASSASCSSTPLRPCMSKERLMTGRRSSPACGPPAPSSWSQMNWPRAGATEDSWSARAGRIP